MADIKRTACFGTMLKTIIPKNLSIWPLQFKYEPYPKVFYPPMNIWLRIESFRALPPYHLSCPNLTLLPSPILKQILAPNLSHPGIMPFQRLKPPLGLLTTSEVQSPHNTPYFAPMTCLQNWWLSSPNLHNHLSNNKAWLKVPHSQTTSFYGGAHYTPIYQMEFEFPISPTP